MVLQRVAAEARVDGRPIRVRRLAPGETLDDERILYVTHTQAARFAQLVGTALERGVLVVTDGTEPGAPAGVVNFVVVDDKVRFDVDLGAAATARLKLSARLLSVARRIVGGGS